MELSLGLGPSIVVFVITLRLNKLNNLVFPQIKILKQAPIATYHAYALCMKKLFYKVFY